MRLSIAPAEAAGVSGRRNTVVAITSERMGTGDDELGTKLMISFFRTLVMVEPAPTSVVFYNAGVKLAMDDSPVFEHIKELIEKGTAIYLCTTCINHFGIRDRLPVREFQRYVPDSKHTKGCGSYNPSVNRTMAFDLLTTVETGGCSSKIPPRQLEELLAGLPLPVDPKILVDIATHDDAGVYKINDETALVLTTDFFPPLVSDGYEFGLIAATNSISDVYAMGGTPLVALNIMMFPSSRIPLEVYSDILRGGYDKAREAGVSIIGGHSIDDWPPKYGLAVIGTVHPGKIITNAGVKGG
ncbi:MAG: selenide, water dikinase SelD [Marinilabiliales bacterium]|nr:selenide, water dikinase SelD [Marinilabiliales bacterium]